jgi:hypothetical protein
MADDAQIKITIAGALDDSLEDAASAAKEQIDQLASSAASVAEISAAAGEQVAAKAHGAAAMAARDADMLAQKQISAAQMANNFELSMSQETLEQWRQNADAEAEGKSNAELGYLQKKAAADKANSAEEQRDLDQLTIAHQEYANQLQQIDERYQEKKHAQQQKELQEFIAERQSELQSATASFDGQYRADAISADKKAELEIAQTNKVRQEISDRLDFEMEAYGADTRAYQELESEKERIDREFAAKHSAIVKQEVSEDTGQWNKLLGAFNGAVQEMLSGTKSFAAIGYQLLDKMIMQVIENIEKSVVAWVVGEKTKTAATAAGNAARTASNVGAATSSNLADASAMKSGIMGHAGSAAAAVWDDTAQIPVVGPILAPAAAAAAFVAVMAFGDDLPSFDVGSWEIQRDMVAKIHQGEMILPANLANQVRAGTGVGAASAGDVNMHYAPTINAREPATLSQMLTRESGEMRAWLNRQFRNGALRA